MSEEYHDDQHHEHDDELEELDTRDFFSATSHSNASRLLEALQALSGTNRADNGDENDQEDHLSQSIQGLLGQLQEASDNHGALGGLFPFAQLMEQSIGAHGASSSNRFQNILESIQSQSPTHVQLSGLSELCETLSLSTEEVLMMSGFPVDKCVVAVVTLLRLPSTVDVLLLAARALLLLVDMFPRLAIPTAIEKHVIISICAKLMEIEYMDVAELAFQILERMVAIAEYRPLVLRENAIVALLQFIEFFPMEIQRIAARVVCQLCTDVKFSKEDLAVKAAVERGVPLISMLLQSSDSEIVQSACQSLQKLSQSKAFEEDTAFAALVLGAAERMIEMLASSNNTSATQGSILQFYARVLSCESLRSDARVVRLRSEQLPPVIATLCAWSTPDHATLLNETLDLATAILSDATPSDALRTFASDMMTNMMEIADKTPRSDVCLRCMKVLYQSCIQLFQAQDHGCNCQSLASFLARVLRPPATANASEPSTDSVVVLALQIVECTLQSNDGTVLQRYERYGVVRAIRYYAQDRPDSDIGLIAQRLVDQHVGASDGISPVVTQLQHLTKQLEAMIAQEEENEEEELEALVMQLLHLSQDQSDGMTAYEMAQGGLVTALIRLLQHPLGTVVFLRVMASSSFVAALIDRLQHAISAEKDVFAVHASRRLTDELEQLTQHIKVRVTIDDLHMVGKQEDESYQKSKSLVQHTVVLVEPLARIETMEEFIADKLFGTNAVSPSEQLPRPDDEEQEDEEDDVERKDKKLQAYYKGTMLPSDMSLLEAIVKFGLLADKSKETKPPSNPLRTLMIHKLWSNTSAYDLTFRLVNASKPHDPSQALAPRMPKAPSGATTRPTWWWDNVWDVLELLRLLHHVVEGNTTVFVNAFVCQQVNRVLQQPVSVVTHALPSWCDRIVQTFPFLLDYDTRFHFLYVTTAGSTRTIQYLSRTVWKQALADDQRQRNEANRRSSRPEPNNALTNVTRMVKLPRLKVRVARSRLLQSAIKLLKLYGGKKAVIEIEFLGEVGTGLGPTTEFYTLVCQELQARRLKLWRDDGRLSAAEEAVVIKKPSIEASGPALPVRGYHRIVVRYCPRCLRLRVPHCATHDRLLTQKPKAPKAPQESKETDASAQCAECLEPTDGCDTCECGHEATQTVVKWWILSDEEVQYLRSVYPAETEELKHPVLQCSHCETVSFPGTDAGIVVLDPNDRMVSPTGRRMYERDYRAVSKHISPLCEGTPLKQLSVVLLRSDVVLLQQLIPKTPEVLETDVEALRFLQDPSSSAIDSFVEAPNGLFPRPYQPLTLKAMGSNEEQDLNVVSCFEFLGRLMAQAVLDERLLHLPLARPLLRLLRGQVLAGPSVSISQSLEFLNEVDPLLSKSLGALYALGRMPPSPEVDAQVKDMALTFTLIGEPSIELLPNGSTTDVTHTNVVSYVQQTLWLLLEDGIRLQIDALLRGCMGILPSTHLFDALTLEELERWLMDQQVDSLWDRDDLCHHLVCDHGYTLESPAVQDLMAILCEFSLDDQRRFLQFVTGASRLPIGGLGHLEPKLTVVRKVHEQETSDQLLPSASTCTNYLKLPTYSSRDVMKQKLLYCIYEGQASFHLS